MRQMIYALLFIPALSIAADNAEKPAAKRAVTQADFEKQFRAADIDGNGMLSRKEMAAKFKRTDEVFDLIDTNMDGQISLEEVRVAVEKSVDAAIKAGPTRKYGQSAGSVQGSSEGATSDSGFADEGEERDHHGYKFYDSLISSEQRALERGEKVKPEPVPNLIQKPF